MNRFIKDHFVTIQKSADRLKRETIKALKQYQQSEQTAKEESKQYKDEKAIYAARTSSAKAKARTAIQLAQNIYDGEIKAEIAALKQTAQDHLTAQPKPEFLNLLTVYNTFGLQPSRVELEALAQRAGGNSLALRALNKTLENTGSRYRIQTPDAAEYEADISELERLTDHTMWAPKSLHSAAVAVWGGTPRLTGQHGSLSAQGFKWDSTSILAADAAFDGGLKALDPMAERWSGTVVPRIFDSEMYPNRTDPETGETIPGAADFITDQQASINAAQVTQPNTAVDVAREIGKNRAADSQAARDVVSQYAGGH